METIADYAKDMRDFLNASELTVRTAFIKSLVNEIVVILGDALMRYTVPAPDDSVIAASTTEKVALNAGVLVTGNSCESHGVMLRTFLITVELSVMVVRWVGSRRRIESCPVNHFGR